MNKRLKKKLAKKVLLNKQEANVNEPKGYGVVLSNHPIMHGYEVGEVVKIIGTNSYGEKYLDCLNEEDGLRQTLHRDQIRIY